MPRVHRTRQARSRQERKQKHLTDRWYAGCDQGAKVITRKRKRRINDDAPAFYRSAKWRGLRSYVLHRDESICQYCGGLAIQADHIVPRNAGGPDEVGNLVASCTSCNRVAGGNIFKSFDEKKAWILPRRGVGRRLLFPVKRPKTKPEMVVVAVAPPKLPLLPPPLTLKGEHAGVVRQAVSRDDRRCIICKSRCERVIRLSMTKLVTLNNAATMCQGCEKAARTLPPEMEATTRNVLGRRSIGT